MRDSGSMKPIRAFVAAVLGALVMCSVADAQIFVSEKEVMRQARYQWLQQKRLFPVTPDPRIQRYVECIADKILDTLDESFADLAWEIVVFDSKAKNASADPSGKIAVYTGILDVADSPDALAAVLGHEIAHVTEEHVIERVRRGRRNGLLAIGAGAVTGMPNTAREMSMLFLTLPFGREQESEADIVGLDYMAKAGFDPRASIYLWKNLSAADERNEPNEFVSSHPSNKARIDNLAKNLTPALIAYNEAREAGIRPNCQIAPRLTSDNPAGRSRTR
ncbi:M48 family metallopeptidase [Candidatus Rariloculus sp.]|uniref:M48 family metallopeptidase n=1 Tax=Candidatus Rariloculus sp. TaxID=3101265 RepID=UPI003D0A16EA